MNSSTGMPLSACTFLNTSSAICGRWAKANIVMNHKDAKAQRHRIAILCLCALVSLWFMTLLPCRVHRLTHEKRRIHTLPRPELLHTPAIHFRHVKVSFLIHAEAVHTPEAARELTPHTPRVEEVSVEIILQHLGGA